MFSSSKSRKRDLSFIDFYGAMKNLFLKEKKKLSFYIFLIISALSLSSGSSYGQVNPEATGKLSGILTDAATKKPVPYATVTLQHLQNTQIFTGGLADSTGHFLIEPLVPGMYKLSISFIGYTTVTDTIKIDPQSPTDIGTVLLKADARQLGEVVISEERDDFQMNIDRKVFNVEKNAIVQGGSALDVLRQVPTVNVDVDGKISMRGSENLVVFINGKPSGLTVQNRDQILQQIPASNIERVELITNPSAKYDAEGMSGIINIVTKKSMPNGKYGSITAGVGTFHKYNASASFSFRNEKWTVTNTLGFRYNRNFVVGYTTRTNFLDSIPPYSANQYNDGYRRGVSPTLTGNIDYSFNKKSSLSLNYMFSYYNGFSPDSIRYDFLDSADWLYRLYYRNTQETSNDYDVDAGLTFIHKFPKKERELVAMASVSYIDEKEEGNFIQREYTLYNEPDASFLPGLSNNYQHERSLISITQLDYTHPFAEKFKFETGGKVNIRRFDNEFVADTFDYTENRLIVDSIKTNRFIYLENVNAVYGNVAGKIKSFGFQAGLRIEQTNVTGEQVIGNSSFTKNYVNFFPSVFLTYDITKVHALQLSYTRRINRPWSGQLNPFTEYSDPLNLRRGNPDLNPESIDAVELSYTAQMKSHTFITTGYFRYVSNVIQRYREIDSAGVSTVTFINLDYSLNFGLEFIARNRWAKWWSTTTNVNVYRNQLFGSNQSGELNATNFSYNIRFQSNWKMAKVAEFQVSLFYMGPNTFSQGRMAEMWSLDAALKFDLLKGKLNLTLNVQDIFNTRRMMIYTEDDTFIGDVYRKRESRIGTIQVTYKFGNAQQPQNQRRRNNGGGMEGGEMDMGM